MAGKPFQSKLTPHYDLIVRLRRQHKSWREIVDHFATLGIKTDKGNVCAFFKRHRARPLALGMEPAPPPAGRTASRPTSSSAKPDLSELLPPSSEFEPDPLTVRTKKRWGTITKS